MARSVMRIAFVLAVGGAVWSSAVEAADFAAPHRAIVRSRVKRCDDACGCWYSYYVRHRVLLSTYGAGFDPNNYDFTEPHYFYGPERVYTRYSRDPN